MRATDKWYTDKVTTSHMKKRTHAKDRFYKRIPAALSISIGAYLFLGIAYGLVFLIPKTIHFSYAEATCAPQLLLAPGVQAHSSDHFSATAEGLFAPADTTIASTKLCLQPKNAPEVGAHSFTVSPFGNWLGAKKYTVIVSEPPKLTAQSLADAPVSAALPLKVPLTGGDTVHTYTLKIDETATACTQKNSELICDIPKLKLAPGGQFDAVLERSFKGGDRTSLVSDTLHTLVPIKITAADIEDGDTIYTTPEALQFTFDMPLEEAEATLYSEDGSKIDTKNELKDTTLRVILPEDIARKNRYTLEIGQAISSEGNSLAEPIKRSFTLSGGPKVASVSAGANNTAQNAIITLTFDQPLEDEVDITKYVKLSGAPGTIQRASPTTVTVRLQNAPLCAAFTLTVEKGLKSGVNNESGDEQWKHTSRVVCGTSSVIGYSVRGRPITAYYFGSGATTILFTGAIHGTEVSSYSTMMAWVRHLQANAHTLPANKRVVVVPNMNPDGVAAGTRNNANNVNLGRNFPTANWKADIETASGIIKNGGGTSAGSEPEAKALMALTRQLRPRLEVSFHSQGRLVGANKFGDSIRVGDIYASTVGYTTMYHNAEAVMGYPMTGEYEDWMGESMGLPAILIELPSHSGNYLSSQLPALMKMANL